MTKQTFHIDPDEVLSANIETVWSMYMLIERQLGMELVTLCREKIKKSKCNKWQKEHHFCASKYCLMRLLAESVECLKKRSVNGMCIGLNIFSLIYCIYIAKKIRLSISVPDLSQHSIITLYKRYA